MFFYFFVKSSEKTCFDIVGCVCRVVESKQFQFQIHRGLQSQMEYIHPSDMLKDMRYFLNHLRKSFKEDILMTSPNRQVDPEGVKDLEEQCKVSKEDKVSAVVNDPKFGMLTLFHYHWMHPERAKEYSITYCTHVFSLLSALPLLVFTSQWMMWFALVLYQMKSYTQGNCPMTGSTEGKMIMFGVSAVYFVRSFFLWDNLITRMHMKRSMPAISLTVILDTFHEFGFNVLVYGANLMLVFIQPSVPEMIMNSLAMEFLMQLDNEFKSMYFDYLPDIAEDIYDNLFQPYEKHQALVEEACNGSRIFKWIRCLTVVPFKLLMMTLMLFPVMCFVFMFYSPICK